MHETMLRTAAACYPSLRPGIQLHRNAEGGFILLYRPRHQRDRQGRAGSAFTLGDTYRVEGYVLDYLRAVDGRRGQAELDAAFVNQYGPLFGPMLAERAWNWLLHEEAVVELSEEPAAEARAVDWTGNDSAFFPMHCIVEIIETCNFACDHCYYSSAPWKKGRMSLEEAKRVMDTLVDHGVRVIELTGGECTIHPQFLEILDYASSHFELVAIITNGYRLGTHVEFAEKVGRTPNLIAQVSIDAMGKRHDAFRKHDNAFDAAVEAIRRLQASGVPVRLASSISEAAVEDIPALCQLGKDLGVMKHTFAPVAPLGRGCNVTEAGAASVTLIQQINAKLAESLGTEDLGTYRDIPDAAEVYEPPRNCGAGWRSFAIDYDGHVRACNFSRDSKKFGNILSDDYQDIFGQQANFLFHNAPSPGGRDCQGCAYLLHCRGCFVKAFMVSESVYPACPWRRRWFPNMPLGLEAQRDGHATAARKRQHVPRFTLEDSPQICTSCSDQVALPPSESPGLAPVPPPSSRPVFVGGIGRRPGP